MKNIISRGMSIILLLATMLTCVACSNNASDQTFKNYSQAQKRDYVENYINENYTKNSIKASVAEVKKVSEDSTYYFAQCYIYDKYDLLRVWIDEAGNITDDFFMTELNDDISAYFHNIIKEEIPNCVVNVITQFEDKPTKKWTSEDNIQELFEIEKTYSFIQVFVDNSDNVTQETVNALKEKLNFCNATVAVHNCDYFENGSETSVEYELFIKKSEVK